jgi:hypothetical protein
MEKTVMLKRRAQFGVRRQSGTAMALWIAFSNVMGAGA